MQLLLLNYSDKCFKSLANCLLEVGSKCTFESLHKLRLTTKKLYALFGILHFRNEILVLKRELKTIYQIYIKSGYLRDNQVNIDLLNKYKSRGEGVDFIVKRLKSDNKKLKESVKRKVKEISPFDLILLNQRIDNTIEELDDLSVELVLCDRTSELFNQILLIVKNNPDDKALHRIRIMLKELIYTLSINKKRVGNSKCDLPVLNHLKKIQINLGDWHDLKVLDDYVNRIIEVPTILIKCIEIDRANKREVVLDELQRLENVWLNSKKKEE